MRARIPHAGAAETVPEFQRALWIEIFESGHVSRSAGIPGTRDEGEACSTIHLIDAVDDRGEARRPPRARERRTQARPVHRGTAWIRGVRAATGPARAGGC